MNRIFNVLVILALVFAGTALASCSKGNGEPAERLVKFHDYLYGMEYDDYNFELGKNTIDDMFSTWYTPDCDVWVTTHTSVYDLNTRTLKVKVNEGLDGMKDYLSFSLNSHFPKPLGR